MALSNKERRQRIKMRIRKNLSGTGDVPRLTVFRSNKQIYAQVIDDVSGKTLVSASSIKDKKLKGNKIEQALAIGKLVGEVALKNGIKAVVFDRNGYLYHGRVKSLAEGARESGLKF